MEPCLGGKIIREYCLLAMYLGLSIEASAELDLESC